MIGVLTKPCAERFNATFFEKAVHFLSNIGYKVFESYGWPAIHIVPSDGFITSPVLFSPTV